MPRPTSDGQMIALTILVGVVIWAWISRFEQIDQSGYMHRNTITGAVCHVTRECWLTSDK